MNHITPTPLGVVFWARREPAARAEITIIPHLEPFCQAFFSGILHKNNPGILLDLPIDFEMQ